MAGAVSKLVCEFWMGESDILVALKELPASDLIQACNMVAMQSSLERWTRFVHREYASVHFQLPDIHNFVRAASSRSLAQV